MLLTLDLLSGFEREVGLRDTSFVFLIHLLILVTSIGVKSLGKGMFKQQFIP